MEAGRYNYGTSKSRTDQISYGFIVQSGKLSLADGTYLDFHGASAGDTKF